MTARPITGLTKSGDSDAHRAEAETDAELLFIFGVASLTSSPSICTSVRGALSAAIHSPGMLSALRGLTLFVTNAKGQIDYSGDHWFEITTRNALQYRKAVLGHDWTDITFISNEGN